MEIKDSKEWSKGDLETVSIGSVHLNKNWSLLMVELEMQADNNSIVIPYKIDTGSEGNIMPLLIFKKLFKNIYRIATKKTIKSHIRLRTYNKTNITQLGMCVLIIKFKNFKKRCSFFVVPGNSQALLGMPVTAALKLININIDSIQAEAAECKTNTGNVRESNRTHEMHVVGKGCTNMDVD